MEVERLVVMRGMKVVQRIVGYVVRKSRKGGARSAQTFLATLLLLSPREIGVVGVRRNVADGAGDRSSRHSQGLNLRVWPKQTV